MALGVGDSARWIRWTIPFALLAMAGGVYGATRGKNAKSAVWYDSAPLLAFEKPEVRAGLAEAAGVKRLEDLPLYDLDLTVDVASALFVEGEDVYFTNNEATPLEDLVFRIYANAAPPPGGPQVHFVSGSCVDDGGCALSMVTPSALRVRPSHPIAPGGRLHVQLFLNGNLTRIDSSRTNFLAQGLEGVKSVFGGAGAAGGDYGLLAIGDDIVSCANFYPVLARRLAGGWEVEEASRLGDLGSDRVANYRARIELPEDAKLAVTGATVSEENLTTAASGEHRREAHVVAAAIRDFAFTFGSTMDVAQRNTGGTLVRSYFLAGDKASGERVLDVAEHALADFEKRFGPYPFTTYSVSESAIVGGAGGVEFSGMVTAASMFYKPMSTGAATGDPMGAMMASLGGSGLTDGMLEFVVAHETAHQWWHGLVGSDSRDHPYVDEALAQYSSIVYLEDRYGKERAAKDGEMNVKMNYQSMRMFGQTDAPADRPVAAFSASTQYAGVIYGKAPYFYRAVREAIGDEAFFKALSLYVQRYRFREAPARALPDLFAEVSPTDELKLRGIEQHWLEEAHGDEDLGGLDLNQLLGGLLGQLAADPGVAQAGGLSNIADMMKAIQGLPSGTPGGAGPGPGDVDVDKLMKIMGATP